MWLSPSIKSNLSTALIKELNIIYKQRQRHLQAEHYKPSEQLCRLGRCTRVWLEGKKNERIWHLPKIWMVFIPGRVMRCCWSVSYRLAWHTSIELTLIHKQSNQDMTDHICGPEQKRFSDILAPQYKHKHTFAVSPSTGRAQAWQRGVGIHEETRWANKDSLHIKKKTDVDKRYNDY